MPLSSPELIDTIHKDVSLFLTWIKWIVCITWKKIPKLGTCCNLNSQPHITDVAISRFQSTLLQDTCLCESAVCFIYSNPDESSCVHTFADGIFASTTGSPSNGVPYKGLYLFEFRENNTEEINWNKLPWSLVHSFLCVSAKFQPISAEISQRHKERNTQDFRAVYFNLFLVILPKFGSIFYTTVIPYKTLIWHPIAWVSCASTRISMADTKCVRFDFCRYYRPQRTLLEW